METPIVLAPPPGALLAFEAVVLELELEDDPDEQAATATQRPKVLRIKRSFFMARGFILSARSGLRDAPYPQAPCLGLWAMWRTAPKSTM